jgi:cytochrome c-type biogenesis protein CcmH
MADEAKLIRPSSTIRAASITRRELVPYAFRAIAVVAPVAAVAIAARAQSDPASRAKALGLKLICPCGCNEILTSCNHVGCTYSTKMLQEINDRIARGDSDAVILQSFVQEYGPTVLATPPAKGFNSLVWIMPIALPIVAILAGWGIVQRWRERVAPAGGPPIDPSLLARAHHEAGDSDE